MLATSNSWGRDLRVQLASVLLFVLATTVAADNLATAKKEYSRTRQEFSAKPKDPKAACQFAKACFDLAEFATNSTQRAELAEKGISVSETAVAGNSNSAAAHYYLAMNLGQLARTRGLGALKLVSRMEKEFQRARELDEHLDYAGPDRNLGQLYRDAPSLGSIGNRSKARHHLTRAVEVSPEYPDNRLTLIESLLKWNDRNTARREFKALEESWPRAHTNFTGAAWAKSWADWSRQYQQFKKKIEEPVKPLETPRGKD